MKILAIEGSSLVASAAVLEGEELLCEYSINTKKTHSQTLLPMVTSMLECAGIALTEIDAIAVSAGPGSFTGLRITASLAKGLAMSIDKPIIPVCTLEGMAMQLADSEGLICPIMDARRSQVYTGLYRGALAPNGGRLQVLQDETAVPLDELLTYLDALAEPIRFLGDGVPVHREKITERLQERAVFAPAIHARQRAAALGLRAQAVWAAGVTADALSFAPHYLRLSQAEREKLAARQ
ncbi:MAG: tRNA (adenosine(37)-N6)-threonylcarbamoyltransferase complex dimerization subunit type 1 TsaB [Lachnospiraceae bacterium]|nr:tRNA (adenosine(37)-N6)-threonylcarbamoyltransferase complex dimerization subunit type 1 TsaB [Lachnospiraceae bacterium]MDY5741407.1 tRNA (adenosine(37)-N6)-threonylcarbamoyltransferase complex dimerization subunit type 1 TsaB [Lachnospiraceae bacterium]